MSALLMGRAFYADLPSHLKLTLLALADHANDDGRGIYVGQWRLHKKIGASERTVRTNLQALIDKGFIVRTRRGHFDTAKGRGVPSRYEIVVDRLPTTEEIRVLEKRWDAQAATSSGSTTGSPAPSQQEAQRFSNRKPTSHEPSVGNHPSEPSHVGAAGATNVVRPDFESMCDVCEWDPRALTDDERTKVNVALAKISTGRPTDEDPAAFAAEIRRRGPVYRRKFTTPLTPLALANNWSACERSEPARPRALSFAEQRLAALPALGARL